MIFLGILQSLVGFWVFLLRKPKHTSNLILAFWLLTIALILGGGLVEGGVVQYFKPGVFPLVFLFGPLLFFYILSQISVDFKFQKRHFFHLLPFLAVAFHRIFSQPENIEFIESGSQNMNNAIYQVLMLISIVIYWIVSVRLLIHHQQNIPNNFSYKSERLSLNWTWVVVFVNILIFIVSFLSPFLGSLFKNIEPQWLFHFNFALFSYLLILFGLIQPVIFHQNKSIDIQSDIVVNPIKKYQRSGLSEIELEEFSKKIDFYFKEQKPFLNPEFDLQRMSEDLQLSRQNLSQVINEKLHKNFYRLANEYRVEEVKRKIKDINFNHLSFLGIALESGFKSKASFNRVFKEITDETPSDYKSKIEQ